MLNAEIPMVVTPKVSITGGISNLNSQSQPLLTKQTSFDGGPKGVKVPLNAPKRRYSQQPFYYRSRQGQLTIPIPSTPGLKTGTVRKASSYSIDERQSLLEGNMEFTV